MHIKLLKSHSKDDGLSVLHNCFTLHRGRNLWCFGTFHSHQQLLITVSGSSKYCSGCLLSVYYSQKPLAYVTAQPNHRTKAMLLSKSINSNHFLYSETTDGWKSATKTHQQTDLPLTTACQKQVMKPQYWQIWNTEYNSVCVVVYLTHNWFQWSLTLACC